MCNIFPMENKIKINSKNEKKKILYWGCAASGKTTAIETLYNICNEGNSDFLPIGTLVKIGLKTGPTIYYDKATFQSKKRNNTHFHCFTSAGQNRFLPLRKKIFNGTDGVIFVVDSQRTRLQDNVNSLKELKRIAGKAFIKNIPMIVMLNKRDLDDLITVEEWISRMYNEGLFFSQDHTLRASNPLIFETIALYNINLNIYQIFNEMARMCV